MNKLSFITIEDGARLNASRRYAGWRRDRRELFINTTRDVIERRLEGGRSVRTQDVRAEVRQELLGFGFPWWSVLNLVLWALPQDHRLVFQPRGQKGARNREELPVTQAAQYVSLLWPVGAVLLADLATGILHWWEDAYCRPSMMGFLGREVCEPNLEHHEHQTAFLRGGFWHRNYVCFAISAPVIAAGFYFEVWTLVLAGSVGAFGNEVHAWSHRRPRWRLPRLLQDMAIIQTPQQHAKHHRHPFDRCYCVLTNVLNPLLDSAGAWRAIEWSIKKATGIRPNHELARDSA